MTAGGAPGLGSPTDLHQSQVVTVIFASCVDLDIRLLDEIVEWVRIYKK